MVSARPVDLVYDYETDSFDLSKYGSNEELIARI